MRQHPPLYRHFSSRLLPAPGALLFWGGWGLSPRLAGKAGVWLSSPPGYRPAAPRLLLTVCTYDRPCLAFRGALDAALFGAGGGGRVAREGATTMEGGSAAAPPPRKQSDAASPSRGRATAGRATCGRCAWGGPQGGIAAGRRAQPCERCATASQSRARAGRTA